MPHRRHSHIAELSCQFETQPWTPLNHSLYALIWRRYSIFPRRCHRKNTALVDDSSLLSQLTSIYYRSKSQVSFPQSWFKYITQMAFIVFRLSQTSLWNFRSLHCLHSSQHSYRLSSPNGSLNWTLNGFSNLKLPNPPQNSLRYKSPQDQDPQATSHQTGTKVCPSLLSVAMKKHWAMLGSDNQHL